MSSEKQNNADQDAQAKEGEVMDFSPEAGAGTAGSGAPLTPMGEAQYLFESGQYEKCREKLTNMWLQSAYDRPVIELYSQLLQEIGQTDSARRLQNLATKLAEPLPPYKHHQELFEAGYALVDLRQHGLAAMLLTELVKELPDDVLVNYELGFSLMCLKQFMSAARHFEKARTGDGAEDFDVLLNLCVCHTLACNLAAAQETLKSLGTLAKSDEEKQELAHRRMVLKRLEAVLSSKGKRPLNDRDWLFILYGSILLRKGKRLGTDKVDLKHVASTLVVLKTFLHGFSVEEEGVEYYSLRSKPLSTVFGDLIECPVDAYRGPDRPDKCLLMMCWTTDILGPHQVFIPNSESRGIFAYAISPDEPLPVIPDILGYIADDLIMPWEGKELNHREMELKIEELQSKARDMEADPDLIQEAQDALDYYMEKRDLLVFGNSQSFATRPEYTAELPPLTGSNELSR